MGTPFLPFMPLAGQTIPTKSHGKGHVLFIQETTYSCATGGVTSGAHFFNMILLKPDDFRQ